MPIMDTLEITLARLTIFTPAKPYPFSTSMLQERQIETEQQYIYFQSCHSLSTAILAPPVLASTPHNIHKSTGG